MAVAGGQSVGEDSSNCFSGGFSIPVANSSSNPSCVHGHGLEWVLKQHDEIKSEPQSLDEELHRLQVLRSYLILDSDREYPFERLTAFASRVLDAPIALSKSKWCFVCPFEAWMPILISKYIDPSPHSISSRSRKTMVYE